jgi:LysR family glycine cleavage system transcriptional activator
VFSLADEPNSPERRRRLPPLAALKAFEAAARHQSFRRAADELCLTPSAVSHQVRALEAYLDTKLFERRGNAMVLTLTGEGYAERLGHLLDGLSDTSEAIRRPAEEPVLRVQSTPGFAARWMVPRLGSFAHADRVRLRVSVGAPSTDFATNEADVVIQWADAPAPGLSVEPIMESARYPVISPALRDSLGIETPADLARATRMQDETLDMWGEWFAVAGVDPPPAPNGPVFPNCELATSAAEQGMGAALAYDLMVRDTLASGRLVRLFDTVTMPVVIYSVTCEAARRREPLIAAFHDWLYSELPADGLPKMRLVKTG